MRGFSLILTSIGDMNVVDQRAYEKIALFCSCIRIQLSKIEDRFNLILLLKKLSVFVVSL